MSRTRRLLTFFALVAVSVLLAWLWSGDRIPSLVDSVRDQDDELPEDADAINIENPGKPEDSTRISFPGQFEFDVMKVDERDDGTTVERKAYKVHMLSGRPTDDGMFLADHPTITFLDENELPEGTVTADEARFAMAHQIGGRATVVQNQMSVDHFTLTGNVVGEFPLADGEMAHLTAPRLIVDGPLVQGPGLVTWTRPDLKLEGTDFTWDGETGRLNYVIDALLVLTPTATRAGMDLFAPGGLTWTIPPEGEAGAPGGSEDGGEASRGYGELRGRVSGVADDGSRLGADTVYVRTSTIIMTGSSVYERREGSDLYRVTAQQITVQPDDAGVFSFAEADGDVHVVSAPFALVPSWMVTDHAVIQNQTVRSPGEVQITKGELTATGDVLESDLSAGDHSFGSNAVIEVDRSTGSTMGGLLVEGKGGLEMNLPPQAEDAAASLNGKLLGGVTGTLPDGSTFRSNVLIIDGPHRRYVLDGDASMFRSVETTDPDGAAGPEQPILGIEQALEAQRITIEQDELGAIALVSADGDVLLLQTPVDMLPTRVVAGRLDMTSPFVTSPGEVTWTRGDMTVLGVGMTYNEQTGQLDYERSAVITVFDPERSLEKQIFADGGLRWTAPVDTRAPYAEGDGLLRGPVKGRSSDGSTLETETLTIHDGGETMLLTGPSVVTWVAPDGSMSVTSTELMVEGFGDSAVVTSNEMVDWVRPDMSGRGRGMIYEQATGSIDIREDAELRFGGDTGRTFDVDAAGGFTWSQPAVAGQSGFGQMRGRVKGRTSDGGHFETDTLWLDGRTNHIQMRGDSRYDRQAPTSSVRLVASRRIDLELDPLGELRWLEAEGDADAWIWPTALQTPGSDATHVTGDRIVVDQMRDEVTSYGRTARYENTAQGKTTSVKAVESIHARTDAAGGISWLRAVGEVDCITGSFQAQCRRLVWNVADDHATLTGECRLLTGGAQVDGPIIDLWPNEGRWHIPESTIKVPGSR